MRRAGDQHRPERIPVHVAVIGQHAVRRGHRQDGVLGDGVAVAHRRWRIVDRGYADGDRGERAVHGPVIGFVGEAVGAVVIGVRPVAQPAIGVQAQRSMRRTGDQHGGQGIALDIGVVGEHAARRRHQQNNILGDGVAVIHRHWRIVDRGDADGDRGERAVHGPVIGLVGETVGAVVVGGGRVAQSAIGLQRQRPMRRAGDQHGGQGIVLDIGVVGEHAARRGHRQRGVLGDGVAVVHRHRRVVDRGDRQRDGGGIAAGRALVRLINEAVGAVVIRVRRVAQPAIGVQRQRPVRRTGNQHRRQRAAMRGGVVAKHARRRRHRQGGVLVQRVGVVRRRRRVVQAAARGQGLGDQQRGLTAGVGDETVRLAGHDPAAVQRRHRAARVAGDFQGVADAGEVQHRERGQA